jgi:hypothetical protein
MYKIFLSSMMFILALFLGEKAVGQITVTIANGFPDNCTAGAVAGTYTQTGTINGKPSYTSANGKTISWRPTAYQSVPANSWHVWDVGGTFSLYYININTATPPCASVANPTSLWIGTFGCFSIEVAGPSCVVPPTTGTITGPTNTYFNTTLFTVTFAAPVTGLTASNFNALPGSGITSAAITSVTGSGTTWFVDVSTFGTGTFQLEMTNSTGTTPTVTVPIVSNVVTKNLLVGGVLNTGDIGFTSYFSQTVPDQFSFITLASIPANSIIHFTDNGWTGTSFRENEGIIAWNSGPSLIPAGVPVNISGLTASIGTVTNIVNAPTGLSLSTAGDQILAFLGSSSYFLSGIHMNVNATAPITNASTWESPISTSLSTCTKPFALNTGVNAFWHTTEWNNGKLNCAGLPVATFALLRAYVNNPANWVFDDDTLTIGSGFPACALYTPPCNNPTLPTLTYSPGTICNGDIATLNIVGSLNDATNWSVYTGSCGGTSLGATAASSFLVVPNTGGTTYYVRGEGSCVIPGTCATITINTSQDDASFNYPASTYCSNSNDPTPTLTGLPGGTFSSGPGLSLNPTTGTIDISASSPGSYSVTYATNGPCPNTASNTITIYAQSSAAVTASATPNAICIGSSATLSTVLPPTTGPAVDPVPGCVPNFANGNTSGDFINNVTFDVINNTTGVNTIASNTFFPTPVVTVFKNTNYPLSVQVGTYSINDVAVWIDFNRDGDFDDAGEKIGESNDNAASAIVNFTVAIPGSAQLGYTRMRIVEADQSTVGGMLPCTTYDFGESEDYQINIEDYSSSVEWMGPADIANNYASTTTVTPVLSGPLTYTVSVIDGAGCASTASVNLTVNALPAVTATTSPSSSVCIGSSATLQGSGAATYSWNPGSLTGATVSVSPTTNTIYTVTGTQANGCSNTMLLPLYVLPNPSLGTASVAPPTICIGNTVSLNYTAPPGSACNGTHATGFTGTYLPANWIFSQTNSNGSLNTSNAPASLSFVSSDNGSLSSGTDNFQITIPCDGIVSFNWSYTTVDGANYDYPQFSLNGGAPLNFDGYNLGGGNTQSGTQYIVVTAGDVFVLSMTSADNQFGNATAVISNFKAPIATPSSQTVTWFSAPVGGSNLGTGNPQSILPSGSGSITYYAQVMSASGCVNPTRLATNSLTVNALPSANAGVDKTLTCTTASTTIGASAVAGHTYFWSPATGLSATNIAVPTTSATTTTSYTLTVTNSATGCAATDFVLVTVNKTPPTANAGADKSLTCTTASSTIGTAAVAGTTYSWLPATALSATNIAVPTTTATATTTYTVTATNTANGCTATDAVVVSVNKTPPTANAGADKSLTCTTASSTIGTAAVAGTTYSWLPSTALSATNIAVPTTSATATTTYTVTATNTANGCTATDAVVVSVNKTPPTANAGADKSLTCTTASSTIGTAAVAGTTYSWLPATALSATNIAVPTTIATATTTYTVTATNTANGCTANDAVVVSVNKAPPTANAGVDKSLSCTTASSTIGTAAVAGNTYAWLPTTALSATNIAVPTTTATATTTYTVTVTNTANGCTATDAVVVSVNKTPPTANAGVDKSLTCTTASSTIGTAAVAGNTYAWLPATALSATNIAVPTTTATATTTYTVTVTTTANGCTSTDVVLVSVNKTPPTVGTTATSTSIACGASTSITGTGAVTYVWQPGSLTGTTVTVSPTATTTYTVNGTASNGCIATATRLITVAPCGSTLNVKAFIEGYYIGGSLMQPTLLNQGVIGANNLQADTITVELHNATSPYTLVASQKRILNTNGSSVGSFAISGSYYIVIKHRNGAETWSANPVSISGTTSYDFSNLASKAFGSNQVLVSPGVFAIYSGDINQDLSIDAFDYILLDPDVIAGVFGYLSTDLTGDGSVDAFDYIMLDPNIIAGRSASTP